MLKILFVFFILSLFAMEKGYTQIQGYIIDFDTKEPVEYVSIRSLKSNKSTFSDKKGFFNFESIAKDDTLLLLSLGYQKKQIAVSELKDTINIHSELIEPIYVKSNTKKNTKLLGDLRKPRSSMFFRNTNFSIALTKRNKNSNIIVGFIENTEKKEGFIEKVLVKLAKEGHNIFQIDPITKERVRIEHKLPDYIKLRVVCVSVSKNNEPDKLIGSDSMVFEIRNYQSQWLDIRKFNIPFPIEGIFVGIQILEVCGNDDVSGVKIPLLFENKNLNTNDFIFTPRGWVKSRYHQMKMPKEVIGANKIRNQTFGFAIQAAFYE